MIPLREAIGDTTSTRLHESDDVQTLYLAGRCLSETGAHQLDGQFSRMLEEKVAQKLELHLGGTRYLSSIALAKMIRFNKTVKSQGRKLTLSHIPHDIYEVFSITRLDAFFDISSIEVNCADIEEFTPEVISNLRELQRVVGQSQKKTPTLIAIILINVDPKIKSALSADLGSPFEIRPRAEAESSRSA